jgi:hypothetical protein
LFVIPDHIFAADHRKHDWGREVKSSTSDNSRGRRDGARGTLAVEAVAGEAAGTLGLANVGAGTVTSASLGRDFVVFLRR